MHRKFPSKFSSEHISTYILTEYIYYINHSHTVSFKLRMHVLWGGGGETEDSITSQIKWIFLWRKDTRPAGIDIINSAKL